MDELFSKSLNLQQLIEFQIDSIVSKVLIKNKSGNITIFAFWEGQEISEHVSPYDAFLYCFEGIGIVVIDKNEYKLNAGEMIIIPKTHPHSVKALTNFKMLLVMIKDNS
ncbi:MAG: cupin domain-containing protein [Candidatus Kapaibacteriota bacterium]